MLHSVWDLPWSGTEPVPPVLAGGFFTTEPSGKPLLMNFLYLSFTYFKILQQLFISGLDYINILGLCRSIPANSYSLVPFFLVYLVGFIIIIINNRAAHFACDNYLISGINIGSYRENFVASLRYLGRQLV